jgi:ABC-type multidrug transport system ATPase subunit
VSALLAASSLRVDVGGCPAVDGLSFATTGDHVLVLGAARALFEAAAGLRGPGRGEVLVDGSPPRVAVHDGRMACAPRDPPMPRSWTHLQYVTWSARLAGHPRVAARAMAAEALERMNLGSMAKAKLQSATRAATRGVVLAAAIATGASILFVEDPLAGLVPEAARPFARVVARAIADRRTVLFAGRLPLESPLALGADEAVVVDGALVEAQGPPAEIAAAATTVSLRVHGDAAAFARAIDAAGGRAVVTEGAPSPVHVRVELGPLEARHLVRIATETNAVVVELRPLARAFA